MAQRSHKYGQQRPPITRSEAQRKLGDLDVQRRRVVERMRLAAPSFYTPVAGGMFLKAPRTDLPLVELWAEVHWTEAAAEMIRADEYRYISPEFDLAYVSPATGDNIGAALLAIGLTNRPFLKGMARVDNPDGDNVCRIQVFATGEWQHPWYGTITVEELHLKEMVANVQVVGDTMQDGSSHALTELMVDYNHMSLMGGPDESKAAGWVRGAGLYLVYPESNRQAASEVPRSEAAGTDHPETSNHGRLTMKDARVRELLGLPADADVTVEHLSAALDQLDVATPAEPVVASEPAKSLTLSEAEVVTLRSQAAAGEQAAKQLKERDARDAVLAAVAAKKVTPAMSDWANRYALADPAGFAAFVAAQPVLVDDGRAGDGGPAAPDGGVADASQVREFVVAKMAEGVDVSQALTEARKQFGEAAFEAYRRPNRQS